MSLWEEWKNLVFHLYHRDNATLLRINAVKQERNRRGMTSNSGSSGMAAIISGSGDFLNSAAVEDGFSILDAVGKVRSERECDFIFLFLA
jgi:DUF917 family protein